MLRYEMNLTQCNQQARGHTDFEFFKLFFIMLSFFGGPLASDVMLAQFGFTLTQTVDISLH